jgi:hypothetical protein
MKCPFSGQKGGGTGVKQQRYTRKLLGFSQDFARGEVR